MRVSANAQGEPWFVAKGVCDCLDIQNNRQTIVKLDPDEKEFVNTDSLGGVQELLCVNESGLYSLIFISSKPEAQQFRRWVTHEVLPAIRKHGGHGDQVSVLQAQLT